MWHFIVGFQKPKSVIYKMQYTNKLTNFKIGDNKIEICDNSTYLGYLSKFIHYPSNQPAKVLFIQLKLDSHCCVH